MSRKRSIRDRRGRGRSVNHCMSLGFTQVNLNNYITRVVSWNVSDMLIDGGEVMIGVSWKLSDELSDIRNVMIGVGWKVSDKLIDGIKVTFEVSLKVSNELIVGKRGDYWGKLEGNR